MDLKDKTRRNGEKSSVVEEVVTKASCFSSMGGEGAVTAQREILRRPVQAGGLGKCGKECTDPWVLVSNSSEVVHSRHAQSRPQSC